MQSYVKPMMRAVDEDAGSCGCNFHFNETPRECSTAVLPGTIGGINGPCVTVEGKPNTQPGEINPGAIQQNTIVGVSDGSLTVTPLANTGLPATNPLYFGIPVGTRGVYVNVDGSGNVYVGTGSQVGASVGGTTVLLP